MNSYTSETAKHTKERLAENFHLAFFTGAARKESLTCVNYRTGEVGDCFINFSDAMTKKISLIYLRPMETIGFHWKLMNINISMGMERYGDM